MTSKTPTHRWRSVLALVGAAAVLAAGADTIAYAATGDSLLLGKSNTSSKTTTVKAAKGPALALKTKKKFPPLVVSSDKLVKKLNADLLDGLDSAALDPPAMNATIIPAGSSLDPGSYRSFVLPAGTYRMSLTAYITTAGGTDFSQCFVLDYAKVVGGDFSGVYLVEGNEGAAGVGDSGVFTIGAGRTLVAGCSGAAGSIARAPVLLSVQKIRTTSPLATQTFAPRQAAKAETRMK